jgi:hypothetical protein
MKRSLLLSLVLLFGGCAVERETTAEEPLPAELDNHVLDAVPADIQNRAFFDFEGKVHIVGTAIEPQGVVLPGKSVNLTIYWMPVSRLDPGWKLFTHLTDASGRRLGRDNYDNIGPLRQPSGDDQALPPSKWKPGKVYVDTQELVIPPETWTPSVAITVGIWKGAHRLDVISGPHDRERRAIIATIPTGVVAPKPARAPRRVE